METAIKEEGEKSAFDIGVHGIHPELIRLMGKLKYRTSYAQNVLHHSIEVAFLMGAMASELGLNIKDAKRVGFLHDVVVVQARYRRDRDHKPQAEQDQSNARNSLCPPVGGTILRGAEAKDPA